MFTNVWISTSYCTGSVIRIQSLVLGKVRVYYTIITLAFTIHYLNHIKRDIQGAICVVLMISHAPVRSFRLFSRLFN